MTGDRLNLGSHYSLGYCRVIRVDDRPKRVLFAIDGLVQGVGFRPFIERLARQHGLSGVAQNCGQSVQVEVQGLAAAIERFRSELQAESRVGEQWVVTAEGERPVAHDSSALGFL